MTQLTTLLSGIAFGEGPRWHNERLYISDMHTGRVLAIDEGGHAEVVCTVAEQPSGLGWDPTGRLLIVSMKDRRLLRQEADGALSEIADLSRHAPFHCNDMVVDSRGRAYIGNFGFDLDGGATPCLTNLLMVDEAGNVHEVATDLGFPNGMVITPDGATLIVGESFKARLTAFTIGEDGHLSDRRLFAHLNGAVPDGICLDEQGAVWLACPLSGRVLRVGDGGEILDEINCGRPAYACMLGGQRRTTLFVCTADSSHPDATVAAMAGKVEYVEVTVPGAGRP